MNRVYRWVDFMNIILSGHISQTLMKVIADIDKKKEKGSKQILNYYLPTDDSNMETEWIKWVYEYKNYGANYYKDEMYLSYRTLTRIIDDKFIEYDDLTRRSVIRRIFRKFDNAFGRIFSFGNKIQHHFLYDSAFEEFYYFLGELVEIAEDYGIDYHLLNIKFVEEIELFTKEYSIDQKEKTFSLETLIDNRNVIDFILDEYKNSKGKAIAILMLSLRKTNLVKSCAQAAFYKAFLSDLERLDQLKSFGKGVDKYLNTQGTPKNYLTSKLNGSDIKVVVEKLKRLKAAESSQPT